MWSGLCLNTVYRRTAVIVVVGAWCVVPWSVVARPTIVENVSKR